MRNFLILSLIFLLSSSTHKEKSCIKGDIEYSAANYSIEFFIKEKYQKKFDSLLNKPVYDCFCKQEIKNLPVKYQGAKKSGDKKPYEYHDIEALFVNLSNGDGLYSKRIFQHNRPNPRFRCGFFHFLFIISDKKYYDLGKDSLSNVQLIQEKLKNSFTESELKEIVDYGYDDVVCDSYTNLPPLLIKTNEKILFDIDSLDKY